VPETTAGRPDVRLHKQRWWLRTGLWLGLFFAAIGINGLMAPEAASWTRLADTAMTVFGVALAVHGWRQGVEVTDSGIRVRRLIRRRRVRWEEIARFDAAAGPAALLRNGRKLNLFEFSGDGQRVVQELERERTATTR
jgi:hypothetical protein